MKSKFNNYTTIYKYTPHNKCHKYDIIRKCELWFAKIESLNDPMDLNLTFKQEYSDDSIKRHWEILTLKNQAQNLRENLKNYGDSESFVKYRNELLNQGKAKIGVLCMSKNPKNILMWSHYANSHSGIVYGFNENLFKDIDSTDSVKGPYRMKYDRCYEPLSYIRTGDDGREQLRKLLTLKALDWRYEREMRFFNIGKSGVAINFNPKCLKYIIFGANIQEQEINKVKSLCKENGNLNHITFKQAQFIEGRFELEIKEIDRGEK